MLEEELKFYRIGFISRRTGIPTKQLQRWCLNGDFKPDLPAQKSPYGIKSKEQQYTYEDVRRLYIIALFRQIGVFQIKEINRMLDEIWDNDKEICNLFFKLRENREEYLFTLQSIVNVLQTEEPSKVALAYMAIMRENKDVDKKEDLIPEALKKLEIYDFSKEIPPVIPDKNSSSALARLSGMNKRTLYRLFEKGCFDEILKDPSLSPMQVYIRCYTRIFLILLMREINPGIYRMDKMFISDDVITDMDKAVNRHLISLIGLKNSEKEIREMGFHIFSLIADTVVGDKNITFDYFLYWNGCESIEKERSLLSIMPLQIWPSDEERNNAFKYAIEIFEYMNKTKEEWSKDSDFANIELEDESVLLGVAMEMRNEKNKICEEFLSSIFQSPLYNIKNTELVWFLILLWGNSSMVSEIDRKCGSGAAKKISLICMYYLSFLSFIDRTTSFIPEIKSMTSESGILKVSQCFVQKKVADFVTCCTDMFLREEKMILNVIIYTAYLNQIDESIKNHAVDAVKYYFTHHKGGNNCE